MEYRIFALGDNATRDESSLNAIAEAGWRVVTTYTVRGMPVVILKRLKKRGRIR